MGGSRQNEFSLYEANRRRPGTGCGGTDLRKELACNFAGPAGRSEGTRRALCLGSKVDAGSRSRDKAGATAAPITPHRAIAAKFGSRSRMWHRHQSVRPAARFPEVKFHRIDLTTRGIAVIQEMSAEIDLPRGLLDYSPEPSRDPAAHRRINVRQGSAADYPMMIATLI